MRNVIRHSALALAYGVILIEIVAAFTVLGWLLE